MKFKKAAVLSIILAVSVISSCTTWSKKEWDELADRTFYFQKFYYANKGARREGAYYFMKEFPVKEMLSLVEKKYNIKIVTDEFDKFLNDGNYKKEVKSPTDTFLDYDFTWEAKTPQRYEVRFEYVLINTDEGGKIKEKNFELELVTNKKVRKRFFANVYDKRNVIEKLTKQIESDK